jgi:hypothetical protein
LRKWAARPGVSHHFPKTATTGARPLIRIEPVTRDADAALFLAVNAALIMCPVITLGLNQSGIRVRVRRQRVELDHVVHAGLHRDRRLCLKLTSHLDEH